MSHFILSLMLIFYFALTIKSQINSCKYLLDPSSSSPLIYTSNKARIPFLIKKNETNRAHHESDIEFHCPMGVNASTPSDNCLNDRKKIIILGCLYGEWGCQTSISRLLTVGCESFGPLVYKSKTTLKNCSRFESFGLGIISTYDKRVVSAAVCYDLTTMTLKYATYYSNYEKYNFTKDVDTKGFDDIGLDVMFDEFPKMFEFKMKTRSSDDTSKINHKGDTLIKNYDFDYKTMLPNAQLENDLIEYAHMFQIIWWRDFQLGNWKYFMQAFNAHIKVAKYKLYIGTTGQLSMPTEDGNKLQTFVIEDNNLNITTTAPELIWLYMKPISESSIKNEIVFVGFNTPFYDNSQKPFCKDICHEVEWLANTVFIKSHLMSAVGLMHCCRKEDVAEKIENFPV